METEKINKVLEKARELYKSSKFSDAEQYLRKELDSPYYSGGEKVDFHLELGEVFFMQEKFDEAERCYRDAIALAQDNKIKSQCYVKLADVFFALELFPEAKKYYKDAVCLDQDENATMETKVDVPNELEEARKSYKKSEYNDAEQSFKKVLKSLHCSEGEKMNVQLELGEMLFLQGNFTEAEYCYRDAIPAAQDNKMRSICYVKLADVLFMLDKCFEAEMYYKKAISFDQDDNATCMCYVTLEKAVDLFLPNISLKGICRLKLGDALYMLGRFSEAENTYKELPAYFQDINMKGTCYLKLGDALLMLEKYDDAKASYNSASNVFEDEDKKAICQLKLGDLSFMQENFPGSERCYEEAIKLKGSGDLARQGYIRLGNSLCQMGRFIEARDILKRAEKEYPTYHRSPIIYPMTQQGALGAPIIIHPTESLHWKPTNLDRAGGEIDEDDALIYSNLAEVMYYLGNEKEEKRYRSIVHNINQTLETIAKAREKKIPFSHIIRRYVKPCEDEVKKTYENKMVYPMTLDKRGLCIILNNIDFIKTDNKPKDKRDGSEIDQLNMANVFKQLQFDVHVVTNLECKDIKKTVENWVEVEKNKDCDAFVLVIMSHGKTDGIYGTDWGAVNRQGILEIVYNATKLAGKPRLTIIQACRGLNWIECDEEGNEKHDAIEVHTPSKGSSKHDNPSKPTDPGPSDENKGGKGLKVHDCLTMSATREGLVAHRIPGKGSPFIAELTEALFEHSHEKHIKEIFSVVKKSLKDQKPQIEDFSRKLFYFVPSNKI